jgi:hypothetical protein
MRESNYHHLVEGVEDRREAKRILTLAGVPKTTVYRTLDKYFPKDKAKSNPTPRPAGRKPSGISLQGASVSYMRPNRNLSELFRTLDKDKAYTAEELAEFWGRGVETVNRVARGLKAQVYIEDDSTGTWIRCVVHPDTAKEL